MSVTFLDATLATHYPSGYTEYGKDCLARKDTSNDEALQDQAEQVSMVELCISASSRNADYERYLPKAAMIEVGESGEM